MPRARERFSFAERLLKSAELSCEASTERKNVDVKYVKLDRLASDFEGLEHPGAARKEGRGQGYLVPLHVITQETRIAGWLHSYPAGGCSSA